MAVRYNCQPSTSRWNLKKFSPSPKFGPNKLPTSETSKMSFCWWDWSGRGRIYSLPFGPRMRAARGRACHNARAVWGRGSMDRHSHRRCRRSTSDSLTAQDRGFLLHGERLSVRVQVNDPQRSRVEIGQGHLPIVPTPTLAKRTLAGAGLRIDVPLCLATVADPECSHSRNQTHRCDSPTDYLVVSMRPFCIHNHSNRSPRGVYPLISSRHEGIVALYLHGILS